MANDSTDSVRSSVMSDAFIVFFHISNALNIGKSDLHWLFAK